MEQCLKVECFVVETGHPAQVRRSAKLLGRVGSKRMAFGHAENVHSGLVLVHGVQQQLEDGGHSSHLGNNVTCLIRASPVPIVRQFCFVKANGLAGLCQLQTTKTMLLQTFPCLFPAKWCIRMEEKPPELGLVRLSRTLPLGFVIFKQ